MRNSDDKKLSKIFESTKSLSPIDRADLLERIFGTFDSGGQAEIDQKWATESEDRLRAFKSGHIHAEPAEQVFRQIDRSTES